MFLGPNVWDPWQIIAQIVAVQCLYYLSYGLLLAGLLGPYVDGLELKHLFDWQWLTLHEFRGWMLATAVVLNSILTALYIMLLNLPVGLNIINVTQCKVELQVQRAKKCLDFSATVYILHFAAVAAYAGFPKRIEWWGMFTLALIVTALMSEWLCVRREMQDIPLGTALRNQQTELTPLHAASSHMPPPSPTARGLAAIKSVMTKAIGRAKGPPGSDLESQV